MKHANVLSRIALLSISSVLVSFESVAQEVPSSVDPGQLERELKGASEPIPCFSSSSFYKGRLSRLGLVGICR